MIQVTVFVEKKMTAD